MNVLKNIKGSYIKGKTPTSECKCMNCNAIIENPNGLFGKKFCSEECKEEYMMPK